MRVGRPVILSNPVITKTAFAGVGEGPVGIAGSGGRLAIDAGFGIGTGTPFTALGAAGAEGAALSVCEGARAEGDVAPVSLGEGSGCESAPGAVETGAVSLCASATAPPAPASARQQMSARARLLTDQDPLATAPVH